MATKPMKSLKLPGLEDTYTFLQNDATLTQSGKAADAKVTGDAIADLTEIVTKGQETSHDVPVTLTNDYVINGNRELAGGVGSIYNVSDIVTVKKGEKYLLSAHMNWHNYFYVFYDADGTAFGGERCANNAAGTTITDKVIIIPDNAVGIRFGVIINANWSYSFKKVTPAVVADILSDNAAKIWKGKKWVAIGDSLTENNTTASEKYHYLIAQRTGITVLNYGKSGTGYGKTYGTSNNFANRVLELASADCDIITIFGSFNDLSLDLGTADDTGTDTLGGWMNTTFDNLYSAKPFVSVGIILPTPWWGRTPDGTTENRAKAVQYCEMLRTIAERRGIPVLDLFHRSNLHPNEENFRTQFFANADGVHPNNAGHAKFAPMIERFLEEIIPHQTAEE